MMINKYSTMWQVRIVPGGYEVFMIKDKRRKPDGNTIIFDRYEQRKEADEAVSMLNKARRKRYVTR